MAENKAAAEFQGSAPLADNGVMIRSERWRYVAIAALVLGGLTAGATARSLAMQVIGWASVIVAAKHARRWNDDRRLPWLWFAVGFGMFLVGNLALFAHQQLRGVPPPLPSIADPFFIAGYIGVATGGVKLIRLRTSGSDEHAVLDALILATAVGVVEWAYVIAPVVHSGYLNLSQQGLTIGYATLDLLLIGVIARLAVGAGVRIPSYYFMAASIACVVGFDISFTLFLTGQAPEWITPVVGMGAFALFATSAAHPTMPRLSERAPVRSTKLTSRRIALLTTAMLMAPIVLALEWWRENLFAVAGAIGGWMVLAGLVMARMTDLVRVRERQARSDQILGRANSAFMASENYSQMHQVAIATALVLAERVRGARVSLLLGTPEGTPDDLTVVNAIGHGAWRAGTGHVDSNRLPTDIAEAMAERKAKSLARSDAADLSPLDGVPSAVVVAPLVARNELRGAIVLSAADQVDPHTFRGIERLAGQFSLALDSAEVTEQRYRAEHDHRFTALVENARDLVAVLDADMRFTFASASVRGLLGYEPDLLLGTELSDIVHPDNQTSLAMLFNGSLPGTREQSEMRVRVLNGPWVTLDMKFTDMKDDPTVTGVVLNARDVTERHVLEEELSLRAMLDPLTSLPNRLQLVRLVKEALARTGGSGGDHGPGIAVAWINIDDFKTLNGSLGFHLGNQVLIVIADRIQSCVGAAGTVARVSGDDFAILLPAVESRQEVIEVLEEVLYRASMPLNLAEHELSITVTAGAVFDSERALAPEELLHKAELAKHNAKMHGSNYFEFFEESMESEVMERLDLKSDLARAVEMRQFLLEYQPVVDIQSGGVKGFEALVRWPHPTRGVLMPGSFISLMEATGLIVPLGVWVIEEACRQLRNWEIACPERTHLLMSVNVSARQLRERGFAGVVTGLLDRWDVNPSSLVMEITESMLMTDDPATMQSILDLKRAGVQLAIDDFGTGYSSLGYIRRLPVDIIKIDQSFVSPSGGQTDVTIIRAVVDLAAQIGAQVVAEGVETQDQLELVRESGCEFAQGFYFAKSMTADAATELLASARSAPFADWVSEPVEL